MTAFRILNQAPQYFLQNGRVNAGGSLTFYEADLTTLKNTWADEAMTTLNANPVVMDAYGRTGDIWGEGIYGVVMKDSAGVVIWTREDVQVPGGSANQLPTSGTAGQFVMWNGSEYVLVPIIQAPDPDGLDAFYPVVVNGAYVLVPIPEEPEPPTPEYDVQTGFIRIGTLLIQWGTGTVPSASGAQTASVNIDFAEEFSATPYAVIPTLSNSGGSTASGRFAALAATSLAVDGCTITANVGEDDDRSDFKLTNTTPFTYIAIGPTVAA